MPELPEVETIRQDLRKKILNKKIVQVEVLQNKAVLGMRTKFVQALKNNKIVDIERRGKLMIFRLSSRAKPRDPSARSLHSLGRDDSVAIARRDEAISTILVHLKMTGQLIYEKKVHNKIEVVAGGHKLVEKDFDLPNKHTQVILSFSDRGKLFFNDLRRFGYMKLVSDKEVELALARFGIEPLTKNFIYKNFANALGKRQVTIKAALMDQPKIAGIGNIYADEICWCAKVKPTRKVYSLTDSEKKKLFSCTPKIIKLAIKHRGTTFKDHLDTEGKKGNFTDFLQVYGRNGQKCRRCKSIIQKIKSGGRGTHFCPNCQK